MIEETKRQRVLVNFLQDFSGSMEFGWSETASGFKTFVDTLKAKEDVEYIFSLTLFSTTTQKLVVARPVHEVDAHMLKRLKPNGGTALCDALGDLIIATKKDSFEADKIVYVVVTDGDENSSRIWTKPAVHSLVDAELSAGKSTFQYLGAQPESWSDSLQIGIASHDTVQYDCDNVSAMYACVGDALNNFSSSKLSATQSMTSTFASDDLIKAANLKFDPQP